jgi:8-oxo-dGTP pyrophosphatase MutT (NUDIX family)
MNSYPKHNVNPNVATLIRKKIPRDITCTNCGCKRHTYKQCTDPVTSWGVILVTFDGLKNPNHDREIDLSRYSMSETQSRVLIETNIDRIIVSSAYTTIKFLMISRKHSVGYVEFIRGRYRPEKIDQVIYLFKQMMQKEIDDIGYSLTIEDGFEYLWKKFWGAKANSPYISNDKKTSRDNFKMLRTRGVEGPDLDLEYIVSTVKAEYDIEEWGFPKGRKNRFETDEECAVREFKEESGYDDDDFKIIKHVAPLIEEFNGTNGVRYRHIYYIAELITNKSPRNNITESQKDEIGNIQFMDFTTALEYIRDYHVPRKIILQKLFTYYLDKLVLSNRQCDDTNVDENYDTSADTNVDTSVDTNVDTSVDTNVDTNVDINAGTNTISVTNTNIKSNDKNKDDNADNDDNDNDNDNDNNNNNDNDDSDNNDDNDISIDDNVSKNDDDKQDSNMGESKTTSKDDHISNINEHINNINEQINACSEKKHLTKMFDCIEMYTSKNVEDEIEWMNAMSEYDRNKSR